MPIALDRLCAEISPEQTALLFGAGSSIPSGAPTGQQLADQLCKTFGIGSSGLNLIEAASLIEIKHGRPALISALRTVLKTITPTGGILNIPQYDWRDIFTTNFDQVIEKSYARLAKPCAVISANYEFDKSYDSIQKVFKLHGTIEKDVVDSDMSRIIITQEDYLISKKYRENLFDRFLLSTASSDLLIIGYSLSDPDLVQIIDESTRRKRETSSPGRIYILSYMKDENRALLLEQRGLRVAFGSLDEFIAQLDKISSSKAPHSVSTDDPISFYPHLRPNTTEVAHALRLQDSDANRMFYGSPPLYSDIASDLTFSRDANSLISNFFTVDNALIVYVLGVAGVGKTTLCRQFITQMSQSGARCWEHSDGTEFKPTDWHGVASKLADLKQTGYLFIDDAHKYLREINDLIDALSAKNLRSLRIIISSSTAQWGFRTKTENIFLHGKRVDLRKLSRSEIQRLLDLFDSKAAVASLAEKDFAGFSRTEKQRRLEQRCEADFFVCLKNIFSNDFLDNIVLLEFADLSPDQQRIYRALAAFEASGVRLHRQMVIRALSLSPDKISKILEDMDGIILESTANEKLGIYVWSGRHLVISNIIMRAKFSDENELAELYETFIDLANPTFEIERLNLMELCGRIGIGRLHNKDRQNVLYAKVISVAPTLRVPRHRLINNLIRAGRYERAASELRIFESDLKLDAPASRLNIELNLERARHTPGLMHEDRLSLLRDAISQARRSAERFKDDVGIHEVFCDVGVQYMRSTGDWTFIDEALKTFSSRANVAADPDFIKASARYNLKIQQIQRGEKAS